MTDNLTHKLIRFHSSDVPLAGKALELDIRQTLTQDATGTLVMLALEAMELERVRTDVSVQYVDHNLLQADNRNADDHLFLESACRRFGLWFSRAGNGVSHPLHMKYFARPGSTLLGSDSHTPASGAVGTLAIGAGGIDVAMAMAGTPFSMTMPEVWGIRLIGELPDFVGAKDVILELLRRHGTAGGRGKVIEYHGPGLAALDVMDRHVIANMGTELGATSTVFPSDHAVKEYLSRHGRTDDWREIEADDGAAYEYEEEIDLSALEPLIALPSSPGNVVPVREVAGRDIFQTYVGSSANPSYRDFATVAAMVTGQTLDPSTSLDINPTSRDQVRELAADGRLAALLAVGGRLHQAGCNGCIGMGQAPASGRNSLRTVPRNFPDRSGTPEDSVYLCSPETAAASAIAGRITDPRDAGLAQPDPRRSAPPVTDKNQFEAPLSPDTARDVEVVKGPGIDEMPVFEPLPDTLELPVLLDLGDDVSTDEIMPAGAEVLPYRSSVPQISDFAFRVLDADYVRRAAEYHDADGHAVVAGKNYGQGSSREHAAVAPRYKGLRVVIAESFARIHMQNLTNFGILPLRFDTADDRKALERDGTISLGDLHQALDNDELVSGRTDQGRVISLHPPKSARQRKLVRAGGVLNTYRNVAE